jgi:glycolate oxidase
VPRTRIVDLIAAIEKIGHDHELTIGVFGHAGDGNLHPTIIFNDTDPTSRRAAESAFNAITEHALHLGGTVTGEHGIGQLKKRWLAVEQGPVGMQIHRAIRHAFDPAGILNPQSMIDVT